MAYGKMYDHAADAGKADCGGWSYEAIGELAAGRCCEAMRALCGYRHAREWNCALGCWMAAKGGA